MIGPQILTYFLKSSGYESDCMFLAITTSAFTCCSTITFFTITFHDYRFLLIIFSILSYNEALGSFDSAATLTSDCFGAI